MEELPQQQKNAEIYEKEYERVKARLLDIFKNKDEQEIFELYSEIKRFTEVVGWNSEVVINEIKKAFGQEDQALFMEKSFNAIKGLIDKKIENPEIFERARREGIMQHQGNIKLSELMYYNVDLENGVAFIHIAPKGDLRLAEIIKSFREGMKKLAGYVKDDERIKEIQAISWIVASNPGLLEKAGFEVKGDITEEIRSKYFNDEDRSIAWAKMSREALLDKYLN